MDERERFEEVQWLNTVSSRPSGQPTPGLCGRWKRNKKYRDCWGQEYRRLRVDWQSGLLTETRLYQRTGQKEVYLDVLQEDTELLGGWGSGGQWAHSSPGRVPCSDLTLDCSAVNQGQKILSWLSGNVDTGWGPGNVNPFQLDLWMTLQSASGSIYEQAVLRDHMSQCYSNVKVCSRCRSKVNKW